MKTTKSGIVYTQPSEGFWDISGVLYREERGNYRLFKGMTASVNQDQLAKLYETEKQKGAPHPTDMPLIWAIATRAFELRDEDENGKLRQFLRQGFRSCPNTLTRIVYKPSGNDRIIHNYRTSDEYSIDAKVVGSDRWIDELTDPAILKKILGAQDTQKINEVSKYINGTNSYFSRLSSKPNQKEERVAGFGAVDYGLGFSCNRNPLNENPAFRVLRVD